MTHSRGQPADSFLSNLPTSEELVKAARLLLAGVRVAAGVGVHLRPVDRDDPDLDKPRLRTQPQHIAEQPRQRGLVTLAKPCDRRV